MTGKDFFLVWMLVGLIVPASLQGATTEYQQKLNTYRQSINKEQKDLRSIKQKLKQQKKLITKKKRKERSVLKEIHRVERKIDEAKQRYVGHQKNLILVQGKVAFLDKLINQNKSEINELKKMLANRVRLIYREKSSGFWQVLASSKNLSEIFLRLKFFHSLASQNAYLINQLTIKEEKLKQQQNELLGRKEKALELKDLSLKALGKIKGHRKNREKILRKIRQERSAHEKAAKELSYASKRLTRLITSLEKRAAKIKKKISKIGQAFTRQKGILIWPTRGRVVRRFGKIKHPRFNTYIHNKGIDIAGTLGQNVKSVAKGYVLFAEWFEGYGRMIILDHGQGYNTVYAHLSEIHVSSGEAVETGKIIGKLGDSGTWKGPALYFEIRKRGKAVNPISWLDR